MGARQSASAASFGSRCSAPSSWGPRWCSHMPALGGQFAGEGAISALTGVRWVVVGAAWLAVGSDPGWNDRSRVTSIEAFTRAGLAVGLLVGLASPLLTTIFGWGVMRPAALDATSLLLVVTAIGTLFAMINRMLGATGASRSRLVWSAAAVLGTLPSAVGAGRTLGSGAVAATWTLHVAALSSISWLTRPSEGRVGSGAGTLTPAGLGAAAAMAAGLATSWVGDRLRSPARSS